jgi:hypothetical protein
MIDGTGIIFFCQLWLWRLLIIIACIWDPSRILLLLWKYTVLLTHPRTRSAQAVPLYIVSRAYFYTVSPGSRFFIMTERDISLIKLVASSVIGRVLFSSAGMTASNHHAHYIIAFGSHRCLALFTLLVSRLAVLAPVLDSKFATVLFHLIFPVFAS